MPRFVLPIAAVLAIALLAAACGDDDGEEPAPTATLAPATATLAPPTATEPAEPFEGGRDPVEVPGGAAPPVAVLVDVRTAGHEGFDRIVFEFSDALPGYRVEYVDEAIGCASGEAVDVDGAALLQVRLVPAQAHNEAGNTTIPATQLRPTLTAIGHAVLTCDFEAEVTWVIGLSEELDFRVVDLEDPFRVVVDVAQP